MDTSLVRNRMRLKGFSVSAVSEQLGIDESTFYRKVARDGDTFTLGQAKILAEMLDFDALEASEIFFGR